MRTADLASRSLDRSTTAVVSLALSAHVVRAMTPLTGLLGEAHDTVHHTELRPHTWTRRWLATGGDRGISPDRFTVRRPLSPTSSSRRGDIVRGSRSTQAGHRRSPTMRAVLSPVPWSSPPPVPASTRRRPPCHPGTRRTWSSPRRAPTRSGLANGFVGNSWRAQMVAELEYAVSQRDDIEELIVTNANNDVSAAELPDQRPRRQRSRHVAGRRRVGNGRSTPSSNGPTRLASSSCRSTVRRAPRPEFV